MAIVATDLYTILNAIKTALIDFGTPFTGSNVYLTLDPSAISRPIGDLMVAIVPGDKHVRQDVVTGAGNAFLWIDAELEVVCWARLALDREGRHDDALTDSTLGVIELEQYVIANLSQSVPEDDSGNQLLIEPLRYVSTSYKMREMDPGKVGRLYASMHFQMSYQNRVTTP